MNLSIYMAFVAAESEAILRYKGKAAWLGYHLSAFDSGITPRPSFLDSCHMLVLTDETPLLHHDPQKVTSEICAEAKSLGCEKILLDFQRPPTEKSLVLAKSILRSAPCAVGITECYANDTDCSVFLPSPPLWTPLQETIAPWKGRDIWLEIFPEDGCITITKKGGNYSPSAPLENYPFCDNALCLSYSTEQYAQQVKVHLHRGITEMKAFLHLADSLGISAAIGLYQQFGEKEILQSSDFMV